VLEIRTNGVCSSYIRGDDCCMVIAEEIAVGDTDSIRLWLINFNISKYLIVKYIKFCQISKKIDQFYFPSVYSVSMGETIFIINGRNNIHHTTYV